MKILQDSIESSFLGRITLSHVKLSLPNSTLPSKMKRKLAENRAAFRSMCRSRIHNMGLYIAENLPSFIDCIFRKETCSITFDSSKLAEMELNNVRMGFLCDFQLQLPPFDVKPSFENIELELKKSFLESICNLGSIPSIQFEEGSPDEKIKENYNFCFDAAQDHLADSFRLFDEFLAEAAMPLIAFQYCLQSFAHLLTDKDDLLKDELKQLLNDNIPDPLEVEAFQLTADNKVLQNLPNLVHIGIFTLDVSEIKAIAKSNVDKAISSMFSPHISKKFTSLIEVNKHRYIELRERLLTPSPEIEQYIEMKRFLESEEIIETINTIGREIKLCRRLNQFEESLLKHESKLINSEYLESLSWVNELLYLKENAMRKSQEDLPRFKEELGRQFKKLQNEFAHTKTSIKEFDELIDDKLADDYYKKALRVQEFLEEHHQKAMSINVKFEILGEKKNMSMEKDISREKAGFERFVNLWKFISVSWNIDHSRWKKEEFHKLDKDEMENVINSGTALLSNLQDSFREKENVLKLVRNKSDEVRKFKVVLEVVKILKSPFFKDRHWDELFNDLRESDKNDVLGLREGRPDVHKLTLGALMTANITSHKKLLENIIAKAKTEAQTEKEIQNIRHSIENLAIKSTPFDGDHTNMSIIMNVKGIIAKFNHYLSECLNMLADSNNPEEFNRELNSLVKLLTVITSTLAAVQNIQQKLVRFSPIFKFKDLERYLTKKETISQFHYTIDEFKKIISSIEEQDKPKSRFFLDMIGSEDEEDKVSHLKGKLREIDESASSIMHNLKAFFKMIRVSSPRYFYITDEQMMTLCSLVKFPKSLMGLVTYLFKGVSSVTVGQVVTSPDNESMELTAVINSWGEVFKFREPVHMDLSTNAELPLIAIVKTLESAIKKHLEYERIVHTEILANFNFDFTSIYNHWIDTKLPYQLLCLIMQLLFDFELTMILLAIKQSRDQTKLTSAKDQLIRLKTRITNSIKSFVLSPIQILKGRLKDSYAVYNLNHYVQLVNGFVGELDYLLENGVESTTDYYFQAVPRYSAVFSKSVKVHDDDESKVAYDELSERVEKEILGKDDGQRGGYAAYSSMLKKYFGDPKSKLVLTMMGHVIEYRYEITQANRHISVWPLFEKSAFSLYLAVATCPYILVKGFANQGKLETVRALACKVGANYYECDMAFNYDVPTIERFIYGMISGGYWMAFKNTEQAPPETLSILASFAEEISKNVAARRATFKWQDQELLIKGGHAVFCTYNIVNKASATRFAELSNKITDQFRVVNLATPDFASVIGSLVSLVFDDEIEKHQWTYRLLMFCKLFAHVSLVESDLPVTKQKRAPIQASRFSQFLAPQSAPFEKKDKDGNSETKTLVSSERSTQANITLRELSNILTSSLIKYFRSLDVYYESFRESFGSNFKSMTENLKLTSDREKKFSTILKKEILTFLLIFEPSSAQLAAYSDLLNRIFKNESGKHELNFKETFAISQKEILKHLGTFRTLFPYPKASLCENDEKVAKFAEPFLEKILSLDRPRQVILLGQPNTQKSTLIRLCSFIESEIKNRKSSLYWLNLDCLSRDDIFGSESFGGILREILIQTNNINLEDMNKSSSSKINFLFESNNELFQELNDPRSGADQKNKKIIDKQSSWIIFDANSSRQSKYFASKVNYLMTIFGNLYGQKEVDQFVGFNSKLKVIYEMHTIRELDPRHVSESALHYIPDSLLSLEDRYSLWLSHLQRQHSFFFRLISKKITTVVEGLIIPLISQYTSEKTTSERVFYLNELSLLNNFLVYFEIFLNEFRKFYIAQSLPEARENPETVLAQRKLALEGENKKNTMKLAGEQFSYGAGMRMAQEAGGISMITSHRTKKTETKIDDDHVTGLNSKEDIEEFEKRKIEGLAIFCFVSALYPLLFSRKGTNLMINLEKQATSYCSKYSINKQKFADGLFIVAADKKMSGNMFEPSKYLYDFTKGKWVNWESYQSHKGAVEVSNSFSNNSFSKYELTRLNCKNTPAFYAANNPTHDDVFSFLNYKDKVVVETSNTKHMRYMLDLFMNYKQHVLLMSDHQQGKSTFLGYDYLPKLIEKRELLTFKFVLQHTVTPRVIQAQIEDNLLRGDNNTVMPPQKKRVIIWIDDLQMSTEGEKPESLVRNLQVQSGWFSSHRKNFIKIKDCQFLMTFSLNEYNPVASSEAVGALNIDVLSKSLLMKTHPLTYKDLNSVFFEQVRNHIEAVAEEKKEKLASKLIHQLVKVVYFNLDTLKKLSSSAGLNLHLEAFCNMARALNMIEWETVAEVPENVLFVWYQTAMNFFSSDLDFQQVEFGAIVEEKRAKLTKMIHAPRKSNMFETGARQRLSVKVNLHLVDIVKHRMISSNTSEDEKPEKTFNKQFMPKASIVEHGKKIKMPKMELIVEEEDSQDSSQSSSNSLPKKPKSLVGEEEDDNKLSASQKEKSNLSEATVSKKAESKSGEASHPSESKIISRQLKVNKNIKETSVKEDSDKGSESKSDSDDIPKGAKLSIQKKFHSDPTAILKKSITDVRDAFNENNKNENDSSIPISTDKQGTARRKSKSVREINLDLPGDLKRKSINSKNSKDEKVKIPSKKKKSASSSRSSSSSSNSSSSESSKSSKSKSKSKRSSDSNESDMGELSEELVTNEEMIRDEFQIDDSLPSSEYFKRFIFNTMKFKLPRGMKIQEILKKVCFDKKQIFDEVLIRELKDHRDNQEENEDHLFIVADQKDEKDIMEFMKTTLKGFIKLFPEALFALKLDGGNFTLLVKHFSVVLMAIMGDFQHMYCSSIKALSYCKTLVSFACNSVGFPVDYVDLLGCSAVKQVEDKLVRVDAYEHILDLILQAFPDIWRLKKRIIFLNIPNSAILPEHRPLLDKVLDLVSSVVLNTDTFNYHLGDRLKEMVDMTKREKLYQHYSEFDLKFTIRNRMEAKLAFIILNDSTETYTDQIKVDSGGPRATDFYRYLGDRFTKLTSKLLKLAINGLKCMEPEDSPSFYEPPIPFEEVEITPTIAKCLNTEMNYLRCVDKDRLHFALARPHNESVILVNVIRYLLRLKFGFLESDSEVADCQRDKNLLCQKIDRRREVLEVEIATIDTQIAAKLKEKDSVNVKQAELQSKKLEWSNKKSKLGETMEKLEVNLIELAKEEKIFQDLKAGMLETIRAVKEYKSVDIQAGLWTNNFSKSNIFVLYSILYCILSNVASTLNPQLTDDQIANLSISTLKREDYAEYVFKFEEALKNLQQTFLDVLINASANTVKESTIKAMSQIVEKASLTAGSQDSSMQRVLMKLVETSIETVKLEHTKAQREVESIRMNETIQLLKVQVNKADEFLVMIEEGLNDLPGLLAKIEERQNFLVKKRQISETSIRHLNEVVQKLNHFQKNFGKVCQPLLDPAINREALIDYLACYIVIFNKYPFTVKKKLLFTAIQNSPISPSLFDEISIYEMLSTDTLLTDAMRNKVPCNSNFLANLAVIDLLQEEQTVLYPLIIDKGKMFVKWCQAKFNKAVLTDRYLPSVNTIDNIEHAMRTGGVFLALDPKEELLKLVRPIIEWQFRRFCENILQIYSSNTDITDSIIYFGKKIPVSKNFFFCVVLEVMPVEDLDQHLLSKLLVLDNSLLNEGLFCETIADELAMNLENNTRGFFVSEYMNRSTQLSVVEEYKKLLTKAKEFDFLKDSLDKGLFSQILNDIDTYELLLEKYERELNERREAVRGYQDSQKGIYSLKIITPMDEDEFRFMNSPFAFKVNGILKMMVKYLPCANRLWIYFLGLEKMRKLVGESFAVSYDMLVHLLKHSISVSEIKVTSADIEKNSPNFGLLFSFVEKRAFQALCSMVPGQLQPHFSFVLGVLLLKKKSTRKVQFTEHLSMFLLSEKILARPQPNEILSQHLSKKIGNKLEDLKSFFSDKEDFLPTFIHEDPLKVDLLHQQLKNGVNVAIAKDSELKSYSRSVTNEPSSGFISPSKGITDNTEKTEAPEFNFADTNVTFDQEARKEISLFNFKNSPQFENEVYEKVTFEEGYSDLVIKELLKELHICYQEMKPKEIAGFKVTYEQVVQMMKLVLNRPQNLQMPVSIGFTIQGDLEMGGTSALSANLGIVSQNISAFATPKRNVVSGSQTSPAKMGFAGISQITLVNKIASFREKKDFKSFSELVIAKEKVKKSGHSDFATCLLEYSKDIEKLLFKLSTSDMDFAIADWKKFLFKPRPKHTDGGSTLDLLPGGQEYQKRADLLSIGSLVKYARPDWLASVLKTFYGELRGPGYLRKNQSIEQIFAYSTNKRATVLLFRQVDFAPVAIIEKMAVKANAKMTLFNAVRTKADEFKPAFEKAAREHTWLVIEGIEIYSPPTRVYS
jgi:hypothetical protein